MSAAVKKYVLVEAPDGWHRHVFVGTERFCQMGIEKLARTALKRDQTIQYEDGRTVWIEMRPVINTAGGRFGSAIYTWNAGGNRALHHRVVVTKHADGSIERSKIKRTWRAP